MSDPTKPNLNTTQAIGADVTRRLDDKGVPAEKHREKILAATIWWPVAGCALAAIVKVLVVLLAQYKGGREPTLTVALIFLGIPLLVLLYAVKKADGEVLTSFLASLVTLGKGARDAVKGANG
jgi:hypothetical protein